MSAKLSWMLEFHTIESPLREICTDTLDAVIINLEHSYVRATNWIMQIKLTAPGLPVLVYSPCAQLHFLTLFLLAGASGYILKPAPFSGLVAALADIMQGDAVFCPRAQTSLLQIFRLMACSSGVGQLSEREKQVLALLSHGLLQKEIAEHIGIGPGTVHSHLITIYKKLNVHCREEAVRKFRLTCSQAIHSAGLTSGEASRLRELVWR